MMETLLTGILLCDTSLSFIETFAGLVGPPSLKLSMLVIQTAR